MPPYGYGMLHNHCVAVLPSLPAMEMSSFQAAKQILQTWTGLEKDALHVYVGLATFLVAALLSRRTIRSILPWLAALVVALLGEVLDLRDGLAGLGEWRWHDSVHDLLNTLFWPTVLAVWCTRTRVLRVPERESG